MNLEEILNYSHSYQFKVYKTEGNGFENHFRYYIMKHGATNRKELKNKYRRSDPKQLITRYLDLVTSFYYYNRDSINLDSYFVRYNKVNFWIHTLWTFEAAVEIECKQDPFKLVEFISKKKHDYGDRNFKIYKDFGIVTRVIDKLSRLEHLLNSNKKPNFESIEDTYKDIFSYCILALKIIQLDNKEF